MSDDAAPPAPASSSAPLPTCSPTYAAPASSSEPAAPPTDEEPPQLTGLHDREIFKAALQHRPLFRLSLRFRTSTDRPVYFQQDGGRFDQEHTLRLLQREEYKLRLELNDLGRTVTNLTAVVIDEDPMKIEEHAIGYDEKTSNHVFSVAGTWRPTHETPTRNGQRDVVLMEVRYVHGAGETLSLHFHLQVKVYAEGKLGKARKGKPLDAVLCRYDASRKEERWTFAEDRRPP